ncbi:MAG: hypothetical protein JWO67_5756 [Streptosporangiaceae bacterium]|nr:hypothetical protein [Streptosporangiaceae bacterium]
MNHDMDAGFRVGGIDVQAARVVLSARWGDGPEDAPPGEVRALLPASPMDPPPRPLRPIFRPRAGAGGELAVLADVDDDLEDRRFLHRPAGRRARALMVTADTTVRLAGWRVVDFHPDGEGGLHLLEFLDDADGGWLNRLRHVDAAGATTWSRQGKVDFHHTEPDGLVGVYTGLHRTGDGRLWLVPRATTAGLLAIDPATGRTLSAARLDADIANLVISASDEAIYARMVERHGRRVQVLARTDLKTGRTTLGEPATVPILDLAGVDHRGHVYSRTGDGIAALDPVGNPLWLLRPRGAVVVPDTGHVVIAYGGEAPDELLLVGHDRDGIPGPTWSLPLEAVLEGRTTKAVSLVGVQDGPRFVLHVGGSAAIPGRLVVVDAEGRTLAHEDDPESVSRELERRESRIDVTQSVVTSDGAILIPLSDPEGYRILCFERVDIASRPGAEAPSVPVADAPAAEADAFSASPRPASGADGGGTALSVPQALTLTRKALRLVYVPATGDELAHALGAVAPVETAAIGGGRPATPEELRSHLANTLLADLAHDPRDRRLWPVLEAQGIGSYERGSAGTIGAPTGTGQALTDERRREIAGALTEPGDDAGRTEVTLAVAGAVLGLRITVVSPDGTLREFGPSAGRPVVLVRLSAPGPYNGSWAATEPVDDAPPSSAPAVVESVKPGATGDLEPMAHLD